MTWRPTQLTREQMEERRLTAGRLLRAGTLTQAEIARDVGVSRVSVTRWKHRLAQGGLPALRRRRAPGRASRLTTDQWDRLVRVLARGALRAGFDTEQWTLPRIASVIERAFGVAYHPRSLGRALRARGFSPQQPVERARERDDALVEAWLTRDWPRVKRGLAEAGVPLPSWTRRVTRFGPASRAAGRRVATRHPPVVRRLTRQHGRREVSSIVALVAPTAAADRPRLYARHFHGAIGGSQVAQALRYFRRRAGRPLTVVWDRLSAHRAAPVRALVTAHPRDYRLEWLPPYAPDLNPEELCNGAVKRATRNAAPESVDALHALARTAFRRLGRDTTTLAGFLRHTRVRVTPPT